MARTMSIDNTDIYRTVVELLHRPDRFGYVTENVISTRVYGPYDSKSQNKDYGGYGFSSDSPRRITKQQLVHSYSAEGGWNVEPGLEWRTYSVTYKNGGEDVDWDDQ